MTDILSRTAAAFATGDHVVIDKTLEKLGWLTPNSYGRDYSPVLPIPALYIFSLFDWPKCSSRALYVGQTRNVEKRWSRHSVLPELSRLENNQRWVIKLFIPWDASRLRRDERFLIGALNPPFNIIGRARGIIQ
jgi:hypothetical protein